MKFKVKKYKRWKRIDRWLQVAIIAISIIICADLVTGQTITTLVFGILKIDNNVTVTSGQLRLPAGTATVPSLVFLGSPTTGIFQGIPDYVAISVTGVVRHYFAGDAYYFRADTAKILMGVGDDVVILRDAANTLALKNGNADQKQRWYGANGSYFQIATQSELLTILAAATTDTAMTIPANAIVRGVAVYVVTVIPGPAVTFTVTGTVSGTVFNTAAVGVAAGSNDVGTQNTPYKNGAAQTIRITPNANPGAATGQVRIVLMYEIPSAPTS